MPLTPTRLLAALLLPLFLAGCGDGDGATIPMPSTSCAPGTAQIQVYDGLLRAACGCAEGIGAPTTAPLTCTVDRGASVTFHYASTQLAHQITSGDAATYLNLAAFDPLAEVPVRTTTAHLPAPGTFAFRDAFTPAIRGQIVVR